MICLMILFGAGMAVDLGRHETLRADLESTPTAAPLAAKSLRSNADAEGPSVARNASIRADGKARAVMGACAKSDGCSFDTQNSAELDRVPETVATPLTTLRMTL